MTSRKNTLPSPDSLAGRVLTLTALSGELPFDQVGRVFDSDYYKLKVLKELKAKKLLRTYYRNDLRGLRLTTAAKKLLAASQPDRYLSLFTGETSTNAPKYSIPHRLRLHRMAEVLITAHNADILIFPWEKPAVFQPEPDDAELYNSPTYYSSREVKKMGAQATMIRGSRATGVLLADDAIFAVYNTADTQMKWEYKAEVRLKTLLQTELCRKRLAKHFMDIAPSAIVFGSGMGQLENLMGYGNHETRNYLIMDGSFQKFHYLTLDRQGEVLLKLLCDPELKGILDAILYEDLNEKNHGWYIEHDAIDAQGAPVLFGYTCDMPRIRRFDTALGLHEQTGTLICFDFQLEALRPLCGAWITFQTIDFEAFERGVINSKETTD